MSEEKIPLSDMIQTLREELEESQKKALNSNMKFLLDSVELEISIAISKEGSGKAGIKFWVVETGGEYKQKNESAHKFKLVLKPGPGMDILVGHQADKKATQE